VARMIFWILRIAAATSFGLIALRLAWPNSWPAEAIALFLPYFVASGVIVTGALILARQRLVPLLLAVFLAATSYPLIVSVAPLAANAQSSNLRLMSANVLRDASSFEDFLAMVMEIRPDVIVLQEMSAEWADAVSDLEDYPFVASPFQTAQGVVVLSRFPISAETIPGVDLPDGVGGALGLRVVLDLDDGASAVLYAIHAPTPRTLAGWDARNVYLEQVTVAISEEILGTNVILAGDWNTPQWSAEFSSLLAQTGMSATEMSAWPAPTRIMRRYNVFRWIGSPIDHIAVTPGIARQNFTVGPDFGSDHKPIIADLLMPLDTTTWSLRIGLADRESS
jgi:endonuclease/exonuclease/phosphatase (EEP) superfamily protein YafD